MNTQPSSETVTQASVENQAVLEAETMFPTLNKDDYQAIENFARLNQVGIYAPSIYIAFVAVLNRRCYRIYQQLHASGRDHLTISRFENVLAQRVYTLHQERNRACLK